MAMFEFLTKGNTTFSSMKLSPFACLTMTLIKRRLNASKAFRFGVCNMTVTRVLRKCIFHMECMMGKSLIKWPTRDLLQSTVPFCFRLHYGLKVVAVIDCFEIFIEKPSNLMARACTWLQYKHYNTIKYLISAMCY